MKKEIILPAVAWLGGIAGFALRAWELATAYDPQMHLMQDGPVTWLLCALEAALVLGFAVACRGMNRKGRDPRQWMYAPHSGYISVIVCAAFVLMASALVGVWQQSGLFFQDKLFLCSYVLSLLGGVCLLMAGQSVYRGLWTKHTPLTFMGPSLCTLVWAVAGYQSNARQPETGLFVWQVLSAVAVVLAIYGMVTLAVGKGGARRTCVFNLAGISLSLTALADGYDVAYVLMIVFALLTMTAQSWMLLRSAYGEPWPNRMPQGTDEGEQAQTET